MAPAAVLARRAADHRRDPVAARERLQVRKEVGRPAGVSRDPQQLRDLLRSVAPSATAVPEDAVEVEERAPQLERLQQGPATRDDP